MPSKQCIHCKKWKGSWKITYKTYEWCYGLLRSEGFLVESGNDVILCDQCWFILPNQNEYNKIQAESLSSNKTQMIWILATMKMFYLLVQDIGNVQFVEMK